MNDRYDDEYNAIAKNVKDLKRSVNGYKPKIYHNPFFIVVLALALFNTFAICLFSIQDGEQSSNPSYNFTCSPSITTPECPKNDLNVSVVCGHDNITCDCSPSIICNQTIKINSTE